MESYEVIYEDVYAQSRPTSEDVTACPSCGSVSVVRKGHDRDGIQRWMCKDCHRTFRNESDTIITRLKLKPAVWMKYLECFVDCLALRECVKRCNVSLRTARLMRMRLIESIKRHLPKFLAGVGASVQLDGRACGRASKVTTRAASSVCRAKRIIAARPYRSVACRGSRSVS